MTTRQVSKFKETEIVKIPLSQICKIILSGTPKTSVSEYWDGDIKWVTPADITKINERYIHDTERKITHEGIKNSSAKLLKKDTIIISARGTVGELCIIPDEMSCNQSCYALEVFSEMVRPLYLFYILKNLKRLYSQIAHGTTFDTITKITFDEIKINLPTLDKQDKIIPKLDNLDSKIENLENQNRILDQMAQAIFKSWFVDFDGVTEFENSELGKIPKGWEVVKFGDYVKLKHGYQFRTYDFTKTGLPVLKITQIQKNYSVDMSNCSYVSESRLNEFSDFLVSTGDVLMALTGATLGKIARVTEDYTILQNYRVGKFIPINPKEMPIDFLYYLIRSKYFMTQLFSRTTISAQENIGKEEINNIKIYLPPSSERQKFSKIAFSITKILELNSKQLALLKSTRDSLLPKLMSGEIRV